MSESWKSKCYSAFVKKAVGDILSQQTLEAIVSAVLDAEKQTIVFYANMKDGRSVKIEYEDKGRTVPGFDADKNRFEALTSWFRITESSERAMKVWQDYNDRFMEWSRKRGTASWDKYAMPSSPWTIEDYCQAHLHFVRESRDPDLCRAVAEVKTLNDMGVDVASIKMTHHGGCGADFNPWAEAMKELVE